MRSKWQTNDKKRYCNWTNRSSSFLPLASLTRLPESYIGYCGFRFSWAFTHFSFFFSFQRQHKTDLSACMRHSDMFGTLMMQSEHQNLCQHASMIQDSWFMIDFIWYRIGLFIFRFVVVFTFYVWFLITILDIYISKSAQINIWLKLSD